MKKRPYIRQYNSTLCIVIRKLYNLFDTLVGSSEFWSKKADNEDPEETFETPDMEEFLRENQAADEL